MSLTRKINATIPLDVGESYAQQTKGALYQFGWTIKQKLVVIHLT